MDYIQVLDRTTEQIKKEYSVYYLRQEDFETGNHTYKDEQTMLEWVRSGDVGRVKGAAGREFPVYPQVIGYNEKKNEEYMAVATLILISRAAVEAGLTSAESFALGDVYMKKLAAADDIRDIFRIRDSIAITYTEMIAERKTHRKSRGYVEECKSYVAANIFRKISVSDAAQSLSLNSIYLERIFKEAEGMTIGQYIQKEKIARAKNLLVYSDRSILEISEYLCFNSQSHFGKVFKKETGMTPRQYRQENHLSGF